MSNYSLNTGYANGKSNGYNEGYAAGKKVGSYTVASFTITSDGGSINFATFDFGQYFSNYSDFLSHTICAVAGSDGSSGSSGSGFSIYNGSAHIYDNTRVEYPSSTSIRVRNYQGLPVGNTVNFICMFTG